MSKVTVYAKNTGSPSVGHWSTKQRPRVLLVQVQTALKKGGYPRVRVLIGKELDAEIHNRDIWLNHSEILNPIHPLSLLIWSTSFR